MRLLSLTRIMDVLTLMGEIQEIADRMGGGYDLHIDVHVQDVDGPCFLYSGYGKMVEGVKTIGQAKRWLQDELDKLNQATRIETLRDYRVQITARYADRKGAE